MRELALRGGPYMSAERKALLAYNETDVVAMEAVPRHGSDYRPRTGVVPWTIRRAPGPPGVSRIPLNGPLFHRLGKHWPDMHKPYSGRPERFDVLKNKDVDDDKLQAWLDKNGITYWPI